MMNQPAIDDRDSSLLRIALGIVAIFCFAYSIFSSDFAELFALIPGLPFPVFVGEILLLLCSLLTAPFYYRFFKRGHQVIFWVLLAYLIWLLGKAWIGYSHHGALALRNSALFYYPLFAFVGYAVFERKLMNSRWAMIVFFMIGANLLWLQMDKYFILLFAFLLLGYCLYYRHQAIRWTGFLIILYSCLRTGFLWRGSRSHMIGLVTAFIFCTMYFLYGLVPIRRRVKFLISFTFFSIFATAMFLFGDHNAITSMLTFREIREQYCIYDKKIAEGKKFYVPTKIEPGLFHENTMMCTEGVWQGPPIKIRYRRSSKTEPTTKEVANLEFVQTKNNVMKENELRDSGIPNEFKQPPSARNKIVTGADLKDYLLEKTNTSKVQVKEALSHERVMVPSNIDLSKIPDDFYIPVDDTMSNRFSQESDRSLEVAYNNILFRLFIWRDMFQDLKSQKAWGGINFGAPQRSPSIEILDWAVIEWKRDGWITPHNSFLHMIYRGGVVGLACVLFLFGLLINLSKRFLVLRSVWGGLLMTILFYWVAVSNFLVILELPYNAIPFWTLLGMTIAYVRSLEQDLLKTRPI